jgi:uncharacterized membrane protein YgaE (UPF0421/DUF939 family)
MTVALATIMFAFGIKISQLYHKPLINQVLATHLGGLILGFVWCDLLCYTIGVAIGLLMNQWLIRSSHENG